MKKYILFLLAISSLKVSAQNPHRIRTVYNSKGNIIDSIEYYKFKADSLRSSAIKQLYESPAYMSLQDTINGLTARSDNYTAFSIFYQGATCDYDNFNRSIAQDGFSPMPSFNSRIGIGISRKKNRKMFDFHFFVIGIPRRARSVDETIKTNFSNFLDFTWGYDFINSSSVSIYPYLGLGLRTSFIKYSAPVQINPEFDNISNIVVNNRNAADAKTNLAYLGGIGMDVHIGRQKNRQGGTIAFLKIGTNNTFRKTSFNFPGAGYKPGYRQGDITLSIGLKMYGN